MQTKFRYFAHGLVPCVPPRAIGKIIEYDDKPDTHWMLDRNAKWRKLSARRFHRLMTSDQFKPTEAQ